MISISILLDLSKRGRWSARSSDLDSMLMTHTPRMCQNNNDARAPAWLGALGYDTGILFHSVFPSITSELKKKKKGNNIYVFLIRSVYPPSNSNQRFKEVYKFPRLNIAKSYIPLQRTLPVFCYTFLWDVLPRCGPAWRGWKLHHLFLSSQPLAQGLASTADIQNMQK